MKIIISEKHFDKILAETNIINEQNEAVNNEVTNDERTLIVLQNRINDIIDKKEKEILDQTGISVLVDKEGVKLQIGEKSYPMKPMVQGIYAIVIPPSSTISVGGPAIGNLLPEVEKLAEYKTLVERHPEIKSQIESATVKGIIFTDEQNQGTFKFTVTRKPMDMGDLKSAVDFGTEYPLGEFMERNKLIYKFKNGTFGTLESGQLSMNLSGITIKINPPRGVAPETPVQVQSMAIGDVFNFDSVDFKDENAAQQQYGAFIQQMKGNIQKYGELFIAHIKTQRPSIYGYSSIDGDPDQAISGGYKPCAGSGKRRDYDMCLSRERARVIADILNKSIPELGGAIGFKGFGETTKWGPGWTKENPTIPEQTAANRRYILSPIKPFVGKQ